FPGIAGLAAMVWLAWLTGRVQWPLMPRLRTYRSAIEPAPSSSWSTLYWTRDTALRFAARPSCVLVGILPFWFLPNFSFGEIIIPERNYSRGPRAKGERLAALVPPDKTLYLSRLKDEGIMFYYRRTVRRLESFEELPSSEGPVYCILDASEWRQWSEPGTA